MELNLHPCTPLLGPGGRLELPWLFQRQFSPCRASRAVVLAALCLLTQAGAQKSSAEQPGHREREPCFNPAVFCRGPFPAGIQAPMCPGR